MSAVARRCAAAIRRVGGEAVLARERLREAFPASIQPRLSGWEPDGGPLGVGCVEYYTMYIPCDTAGDLLEYGDTVTFRESDYQVCKVETMYLSGVPVYRWAALRRESGGNV